MREIKNIVILGASGYTGAELVRLISTHPRMQINALSADRKAGMKMGDVFPHLAYLNLPILQKFDDIDFSDIDLVFCALPHGVTHGLVKQLPHHIKVVDLSADFRLYDPHSYKKWYGIEHGAMDLQPSVAYGLPEFYRTEINAARITANTGCYVATGLLALIPALHAGAISTHDIIINAASGVTGAGRAAKEGLLFSEVADGFHAYAIAGHRHMAEFDQELSRAARSPVEVSFTPHLLPQSRGILATIYAKGDAKAVYNSLCSAYQNEHFVSVLPFGQMPATHQVRGSNMCLIGVNADRIKGRVIIIATLDNLMKGASGQAIQNANIMLNLPEEMGINLTPLFP